MPNICLLFGGNSNEHLVSIQSAYNIYNVLKKEPEFNILLVGINKRNEWRLLNDKDFYNIAIPAYKCMIENEGKAVRLLPGNNKIYVEDMAIKVDIAFPVIHGKTGEDGKLQAILEMMNIPYVGSDSLSSYIGYDKELAKIYAKRLGIGVIPYEIFYERPTYNRLIKKFGAIFFLKPARSGSSLGVHMVKNEEDFLYAWEDAKGIDHKIIIEKYIKGRELECAVLDDSGSLIVSYPGEIILNHKFYSYEAKYINKNGAKILVNPVLKESIVKKIQKWSKILFKGLSLRGYARIDFLLDNDENLFFNEVNTIPGFTNISMFPMLMERVGYTYEKLLKTLINTSLIEFLMF